MPDFNVLRWNQPLFDEIKEAKQLRQLCIDADTVGKVAISIERTVMIHPKKKFKNWVKHIRKELSFRK